MVSHLMISTFLLTLLLPACLCDMTSFRYDLGARDDICFTESLPENQSVIVEVVTASESLTLKVVNPRGQTIFNRGNQQSLRYPFTSYDAGIYQICVVNGANFMTEFAFVLKTGIDAKDYTDLVTKKHLEPAELEAQKLLDTIKELHKSMKRSISLEDGFFNTQKRLKFTMVG